MKKPLRRPLPSDPRFKKILKRIRLVAFDVDGVLTDGTIHWIEGQQFTRHFVIKDGFGMRLLRESGIEVAIVTGNQTLDVKERAKWLKLEHAYFGREDKLECLRDLSKKTGIALEEMAFIGDELFDIPALEAVGFSATVPDAPAQVIKRVMSVTATLGGRGAGRELCDAVLIAQGKLAP